MVMKNDTKIPTKLRWAKLIIVALTILVPMIFLYIMFITYTTIEQPMDKRLTLSPVLKSRVKAVGDINENIVAIQIVHVDLSKNVRSLRFMYIKDSRLSAFAEEYNKGRISPFYPVFTSDNINNDRITRIINHEFVCSPYEETLSAKVVPVSTSYVKVICSIGIPPSYGRFNGIVAILLKNTPSENEIAIIRSYIKKLSIDIDSEV